MNKEKKGMHAAGMIGIRPGYGHVSIEYREHDSRDGRLLVMLDGYPLDARDLTALTQELLKKEQELDKMRKLYAELAFEAAVLGNFDDPPVDPNQEEKA
jgi:hypothetical protein